MQTEQRDQSFSEPSADDHAMLSFQDTMRRSCELNRRSWRPISASAAEVPGHGPALATVHQPLDGATTLGPEPGPWAGEVCRLVPGAEVETLLVLEAHDDPIAQHHTLGGRKISALDPTLLGLPVLPFAVMAEMTAQVAALLVDPGLVLTGLKAGSSSQVGALRGAAGLPRAARAACVVDG